MTMASGRLVYATTTGNLSAVDFEPVSDLRPALVARAGHGHDPRP
jgi:hypothetical protein